jgi:hypothetical protein
MVADVILGEDWQAGTVKIANSPHRAGISGNATAPTPVCFSFNGCNGGRGSYADEGLVVLEIQTFVNH